MPPDSGIPASDFTIRPTFFIVGAGFFLLGVVGGFYFDSIAGLSASVIYDGFTFAMLVVVLALVRCSKLSLSAATAALVYLGASNFVVTIIVALVSGPPNPGMTVFNHLFLLALFFSLSAFLVGRYAPLFLGGTILTLLLASATVLQDSVITGGLWYEVPGIVGGSILLFRYRTSLDRILGDLQRTIRENQAFRNRERLAALGELAAGIAHEIKNPLNFVVNFAESSGQLLADLEVELAKSHPTAADLEERAYLLAELRQNMKEIQDQGLRGVGIIQSMLQNVRSDTGLFRPIELNALAEECLNLARLGQSAKDPSGSVVPEVITCSHPVIVLGSRGDLTRAFVNLCSNALWSAAKKALRAPPSFVPRVTVVVRVEGALAKLEVRDNGLGLEPAIRDRLFVPFFTTKPAGEGTGLGLSLTREIVVDQHRGTIEVDGDPKWGACFTVTLPLLGGSP